MPLSSVGIGSPSIHRFSNFSLRKQSRCRETEYLNTYNETTLTKILSRSFGMVETFGNKFIVVEEGIMSLLRARITPFPEA